MNDYPAVAQGQGGRQVYVGKDTGQIFDHHIVEFTYPNGHKMISQCRHIPIAGIPFPNGCMAPRAMPISAVVESSMPMEKRYFKCKEGNGQRGGHQQEHHDMFADLRNGLLPNETEYGAKSTMTAIFGRMATYSGQEIHWDDAINSKISLADVEAIQANEGSGSCPARRRRQPTPCRKLVPAQKRFWIGTSARNAERLVADHPPADQVSENKKSPHSSCGLSRFLHRRFTADVLRTTCCPKADSRSKGAIPFRQAVFDRFIIGSMPHRLHDAVGIQDHDRGKPLYVVGINNLCVLSSKEGTPDQVLFLGGCFDIFQLVAVIDAHQCKWFVF